MAAWLAKVCLKSCSLTPQRFARSRDGGTNNPGENGEDQDILGKDQQDLTAEDLEGDGRTEDDTSDLPDAETKFLGDFA